MNRLPAVPTLASHRGVCGNEPTNRTRLRAAAQAALDPAMALDGHGGRRVVGSPGTGSADQVGQGAVGDGTGRLPYGEALVEAGTVGIAANRGDDAAPGVGTHFEQRVLVRRTEPQRKPDRVQRGHGTGERTKRLERRGVAQGPAKRRSGGPAKSFATEHALLLHQPEFLRIKQANRAGMVGGGVGEGPALGGQCLAVDGGVNHFQPQPQATLAGIVQQGKIVTGDDYDLGSEHVRQRELLERAIKGKHTGARGDVLAQTGHRDGLGLAHVGGGDELGDERGGLEGAAVHEPELPDLEVSKTSGRDSAHRADADDHHAQIVQSRVGIEPETDQRGKAVRPPRAGGDATGAP